MLKIKTLALLLAIQALFFAVFVTPLADVPDESGHFAYVTDITKGRPLPVYLNVTNGRGVIPDDLWVDWGAEKQAPRANYIVQHPPLYYLVVSVPYAVATHFTDDRFIHAYAARSVSAISLGIIVIAVYLTLVAVGVGQGQALLMSSWLPLLPMMTHLSSGITNDVFLVMLCALATLYLVKYLQQGHIRFAYYCAFWLACAGATKMTAWLLIAAYVGILVFELRGTFKSWLRHSLLVSGISLVTALWWMRRNYYWHGNPFHVSGDGNTDVTHPISLVSFFQDLPFVQWFMQHTHGLFGFSGYCLSANNLDALKTFCKGLEMTVVHGAPYWLMLASMSLLAVALWFFILRIISAHHHPSSPQQPLPSMSSMQTLSSGFLAQHRVASVSIWGLFALMGLALAYWFISTGFKYQPVWGHFALAPAALLLGVTVAAFPGIFLSSQLDTRLAAYGTLAAMLFIFTLFTKSHGAYEIEGALRGVQGRYLFPFYPLLLVAIGVAIKNNRLWLLVSLGITFALVWGHAYSYSHVVMPFFHSVKL